MLDPRARKVVEASNRGRDYRLKLECGHTLRRRYMVEPKVVVCSLCPPAGGLGGYLFEKGK